MALRQSSELRVILGAGCRRPGDIKESDTSRKMNFELSMSVCSLGIRSDLPAQQHVQTGGDACVRASEMGNDGSQYGIVFRSAGSATRS